MKVIFSRKGFDSSSGCGPSPIIGGRPVSLPIPTGDYPSETTYGGLGLGDVAAKASGGEFNAKDLCHYDPMFEKGRCAFGQSGKAQEGHLAKQKVGAGDVFLFFGWFFDEDGGDHHRIFGYLKVEERIPLGSGPNAENQPSGFSIRHPHTIPDKYWEEEAAGYNTLYVGEGFTANAADEALRLTAPGCSKRSFWRTPAWLREAGMTYHQTSEWETPTLLKPKKGRKGQDFVSDISGRDDAKEWVEMIIAEIRNGR